jgi:hypothetical protein
MRAALARFALACVLAACATGAQAATPPERPDAEAVRAELVRIGGEIRAQHALHLDPDTIVKRWGAGLQAKGIDFAADTLRGRVLLVCMEANLASLQVALVDAGEVRVLPPAPGAPDAAVADRLGQFMAIADVFLVRPSAEPGGRDGPLAALLWMGETGSASPHSLWHLPLGGNASLGSLRETDARAAGAERTLELVRRDGDAQLRTFGHLWGLSQVLWDFCGGCPHLAIESTWRLSAEESAWPRLVGATLADDGLGALARAYEAERGLHVWPADDVTRTGAARAWMRSHPMAFAMSWLGEGAAVERIVLQGAGARADTAAFALRRTGHRWSVDLAR